MAFSKHRRLPDPSGSTSPRRDDSDLSLVHYYVRMTAIFMFVLLSGFSAGILVERLVIQSSSPEASGESDLDAVSSVIEENYYYRPTDTSERAAFQEGLERNAINGMLTSLDDRYTRYLLPEDAQIASDQLEGEYGGTGITLEPVHGTLVVVRVDPDTPAARAGVVAGDVVQRIDNRLVDQEGEPTLTGDLRGPVGSSVTLLIERPGTAEPINVSMVRESIIVHPVSFEMIPGTTYARIRVDIFGDRTTTELDQAIASAQAEGASGIILDLRGNGGGWVTAAQETIGRFLSKDAGPALFEDVTPGRGGEYELPIVNPDAGPSDLPVVVLVDKNTASAAEIVAGSLRDYDRALIVGEQTFGKGSVQRIFDFDDGASLRVTVAEWITPSKGRIQDEGIRPDVVVDSSAYGTTSGDPFVGAAVTMLENGISRPTHLADPRAIPGTPSATPQSFVETGVG